MRRTAPITPGLALVATILGLSLALASTAAAQRIHGDLREWTTVGYAPYDIVTTPDGIVWMTHDIAVARFDPSTGSTRGLYPLGADRNFQTMTRASDGMIWVADANERLYRLDPGPETFTTFSVPAATFPSGCGPRGLTEGPDGAIWFTCSTDLTIGRLDPGGSSWSRYLVGGSQLPDPPDQIVFDPDGIAWFSIRAGSNSQPGFGWLDPADPSSASSGWLTSPLNFDRPIGIVSHLDAIWLVDHGWNGAESQIVRINRLTKAHAHYQLPDEVDDAHLLTIGPDDRLYTAGFVTHSIASFDPVTHLFQIARLPSADAWPMGITTDVDGSVWIAESGPPGSSGGVARLALAGPSTLAVGTLEGLGAGGEGAVAILYGARGSGLSSEANMLLSEDTPGTLDTAEADDLFGWAVASGDFNGDLVMDLAVGVPAEDVDGVINAGAVHIVYGTRGRLLDPDKDEIWDQNAGLLDTAEVGDNFGRALAAGDFNGDGFDDLAVGVPWEDVGDPAVTDSGAVALILGSASGLVAAGNQLWYQGKDGIANTPEPDDGFGSVLASGNFDGDGFDDLAVGIPEEDWSTLTDAGCVQVLYGSLSGLTWSGDQLWRQGADGVQDTTEADDETGASLAVGRFNDDSYDDLAFGAPGEGIDLEPGAGSVHILYGSASGLTSTGNQRYDQSNNNITGDLEDGDHFAAALAAGDLNGDGMDDLAIGVPFESVDGINAAGAVNVLYGTATGLTASGSDYWHQNSTGIGSFNEDGDRFGETLTVGDLDDDGYRDLVVGAPFEDINTPNAGSIHVIYGSIGGLTGADSWFVHQGLAAIVDSDEELDRFGWSLCTLGGLSTVLFADDLERGDTSRWSAAAP